MATVKKHDNERSHHAQHLQGLPKKGGAGGKFTWGVAGKADASLPSIDPHDPAYDSEEEEAAPRPLANQSHDKQQAFKARCVAILNEYFKSTDVKEVTIALQEIGEVGWMYEFAKQAITLALDKHDNERELVSQLLSALYGHVITQDQMVHCFLKLFERLEELKIDTPNAVELVSNFLARAINDEILPPAFLSHVPADLMAIPFVRECVSRASSLLQGTHVGERMQKIWGNAVNASAKALKKSFQDLVREYLVDGGDVAEAAQALRDLDVPAVHYRFVKAAVEAGLSGKPADRQKIITLLGALHKQALLSETHLVTGFRSCIQTVADLQKDIGPTAKDNLLEMIAAGEAAGFLPKGARDAAAAEIARNLQTQPGARAEVKPAAATAATSAAK
jgi:programmed cell death protein 4